MFIVLNCKCLLVSYEGSNQIDQVYYNSGTFIKEHLNLFAINRVGWVRLLYMLISDHFKILEMQSQSLFYL